MGTIQIQSPSLQPVNKDHEQLSIQERRLFLVQVTWKVKFLLNKQPRETDINQEYNSKFLGCLNQDQIHAAKRHRDSAVENHWTEDEQKKFEICKTEFAWAFLTTFWLRQRWWPCFAFLSVCKELCNFQLILKHHFSTPQVSFSALPLQIFVQLHLGLLYAC